MAINTSIMNELLPQLNKKCEGTLELILLKQLEILKQQKRVNCNDVNFNITVNPKENKFFIG